MEVQRVDAASIQAEVLTNMFAKDASSTIVLINGLPWWYTDAELKKSIEAEVVPPKSVYIVLHPSTGASSGFAFVDFPSASDAATCVAKWPTKSGIPTPPTAIRLSISRELARFLDSPVGLPPLPVELDGVGTPLQHDFLRAFDHALAPPNSWPFRLMQTHKFDTVRHAY